ncbi:signal peptide peptidase SppA [Nocardioides marinquilinus]|uniref:Signal peptide peptidase SppA n=1 Tax=Nocardioides marinquilinus TaxID=1210400 RepID=A0ABP9Q4C6_9ACTN
MSKRARHVVLELDLAGGVAFAPPANPLEAWRLRLAPSVRAVREGLRRAAGDDAVRGLVVHLGTCPLTLAQADEVAGLVADFTEHKPSIAWTATFGELTSGLAGYRAALGAGEVWLQPSGALGVAGVHLGITLLRGGLEKLGLDPQFGQRHEYKSAADQLGATEVSDANREMVQRLADSILDDTVARTAARRSLDPAPVREAVAQAPLSAARALEAGLVDRLGYRDEVYARLREQWGDGSGADGGDGGVDLRYLQRYHSDGGRRETLARLTRHHQPAVAVVDVTGPIVLGPARPGQAGDDVTARLREVGRDDDVSAVVLRVDSPGGSYVASDAMRREVVRLREAGTPVVATMGTAAASGGYFVAMAADEVVAQPTTLTGSIGVLAGKIVVGRLLERAGIVHEPVDAGPRASLMAATVPFDDEAWRVLDAWLDEVYADFTTKAAADRGLDLAVLEPLARGRVWTGADAAERGLVDHLGGSALALDRACALAGVERDRVRLATPSPLAFLKQLRPPESSEAAAAGARAAGFASVAAPVGPEALLRRLAEAVGVHLPHGVLSMPSGFEALLRPSGA